jgi:glycosyltransferase involved in cell wall biosynthesis
MRILHFIYDDPENKWCAGGGAIRALEINKRIAEENEIRVFTGNFPGSENKENGNLKIKRIGISKSYLLSRMSYSILAPFYLMRYKSDIIVNDFSVFSPLFCELFTRKTVINSFYHFVGKHAFKKYSVFGIIPYLAEKILLKISRNFITISPSVTEILKGRLKKERNIRCIYTGISDNIFDPDCPEGTYIAYLGRIDIYMKGIDILLNAFTEIEKKDVKLKIAGIGKEKDIKAIRSMISDLNIEERVEFLGSLNEEEKRDFITNSMFFVMPSRFEGWGIVAIEAQACGKAVIGTDIPGLRDAVKDEETGILVEPENISALKEAINILISDENKRMALGKNGLEWAKNFKWDNIASDQQKFYTEVLNEACMIN